MAVAAADLFYEQGIHRSTVDQAAARAGLSKPTLYQHFRSKEELIEAALDFRDRRHRARLAALWEQSDSSPEDRMLAAFGLLEEWLEERPDFRGCAFINAAVELTEAEHPGKRIVREHKRWLRDYLEECGRELGSSDASGLAAALLYLLEGAMVMAYVDGDRAAGLNARRAARALIAAYTGAPE